MLLTFGLGILCFVGSLLLDFCYTKWTIFVSKREILKAVIWSGTCSLVSTILLFVIIEYPWTAWASIVGHMSGTYLAMLYERPEPNEEKETTSPTGG